MLVMVTWRMAVFNVLVWFRIDISYELLGGKKQISVTSSK